MFDCVCLKVTISNGIPTFVVVCCSLDHNSNGYTCLGRGHPLVNREYRIACVKAKEEVIIVLPNMNFTICCTIFFHVAYFKGARLYTHVQLLFCG